EVGVPAEKFLVQRNGVNAERFQVRAREEARRALVMEGEGYHLVYVGTFRVTKGLDVLLEAVRRLVADGFPLTLHLVGDGPHLEASLREQARAGGIEPNV